MTRRILLVAHPNRPGVVEIAREVVRRLAEADIEVALAAEEVREFTGIDIGDVAVAQGHGPDAAKECELVVVLGGDGTILRGAEHSRGTEAPLLGVNLGHVGFLAEAEREEVAATVRHIVERSYVVEERMTLDVCAWLDGVDVDASWALNEVSVEKAARERMIEVTVEIDGRPLSTWGCDGVLVATPTGSTAYAFSAGGPVVWPDVEAILMVPLPPTPSSPDLSWSVRAPGWRWRSSRPPRATGSCGATGDDRSTSRQERASRCRRSEVPVRLARLGSPPVH